MHHTFVWDFEASCVELIRNNDCPIQIRFKNNLTRQNLKKKYETELNLWIRVLTITVCS